MRVREIMVTDIITVNEDDTALDALIKLGHHSITGLPVLDKDGNIIGLVSEADVLRLIGSDDEGIDTTVLEETPVSKLIFRKLISTDPDKPVIDVAHQMIINKVKRLPVLEEGNLVGIISRSDIVRAYFERLQKE